jgi:hypothetical protein
MPSHGPGASSTSVLPVALRQTSGHSCARRKRSGRRRVLQQKPGDVLVVAQPHPDLLAQQVVHAADHLVRARQRICPK